MFRDSAWLVMTARQVFQSSQQHSSDLLDRQKQRSCRGENHRQNGAREERPSDFPKPKTSLKPKTETLKVETSPNTTLHRSSWKFGLKPADSPHASLRSSPWQPRFTTLRIDAPLQPESPANQTLRTPESNFNSSSENAKPKKPAGRPFYTLTHLTS